MYRLVLSIFPLLLMALAVAGCGSNPGTANAPEPEGELFDMALATATLSGKVHFSGSAPAPEKIRMNGDPYCLRNNQNPLTEEVIVNEDGTLKNVVVFVRSGLGRRRFAKPTEPVVLDQNRCRFEPHVFTFMVSQPLRIRNSDATVHNIRTLSAENAPFNFGQPTQGLETDRVFAIEETPPFPIKCDVHNWMKAYAGVFSHPFHRVTGSEGTFEMKLPAGRFEIVAWHELFGEMKANVELAENASKQLDFTFEPGPRRAGN